MRKIINYFSFGKIINILMDIDYKLYHIIMLLLILIGAVCNCFSKQPLPRFWLLTISFAIMIYINIYAIKQVGSFFKDIEHILSGELILFLARKEFLKHAYSNINWAIILCLPACIVPVVIYIIKYPLGLPIKIFAFTALYFIISLCFINYMQYIYLIMLSHYLYIHYQKIEQYDRARPHKTNWIMKISALTNKQSNLFFVVGSMFIILLQQITFSELYDVNIDNDIISKGMVIYLWLIIVFAIIIMFPVFSVCSYLFIKCLIDRLTEKSIQDCENMNKIFNKSKKRKKYLELVQLNELKILMLEKNPSYPRKPLVAYAFSYIFAILNFGATIQAIFSLYNTLY